MYSKRGYSGLGPYLYGTLGIGAKWWTLYPTMGKIWTAWVAKLRGLLGRD